MVRSRDILNLIRQMHQEGLNMSLNLQKALMALVTASILGLSGFLMDVRVQLATMAEKMTHLESDIKDANAASEKILAILDQIAPRTPQ